MINMGRPRETFEVLLATKERYIPPISSRELTAGFVLHGYHELRGLLIFGTGGGVSESITAGHFRVSCPECIIQAKRKRGV